MNDFVFNGCHYLCDYVKVPQNHTLPPQMSVLLLFADFFFSFGGGPLLEKIWKDMLQERKKIIYDVRCKTKVKLINVFWMTLLPPARYIAVFEPHFFLTHHSYLHARCCVSCPKHPGTPQAPVLFPIRFLLLPSNLSL